MNRITESELILPALYIMKIKNQVSTSQLISDLAEIFQPTGEDATILDNRSDTKFSQKVRNLVSHHTLDQKLEYTFYSREESNGIHTLTTKGLAYLLENINNLSYIFNNNFLYPDVVKTLEAINIAEANKTKIEVYDENATINEGNKKTRTTKVAERSQKLRDCAINYYSKNGHIVCTACNFDFFRFYGNLGKGYIEIHHTKPLYQYENEDQEQFIDDAVKIVKPLCANCHRMIHRDRRNEISIDQLKSIIENQNTSQ